MKKFIVYGSKLCPDCPPAIEAFKKYEAKYLYLDITEELSNLKKFLKYRDTRKEFQRIKSEGSIGIPLIVDEEDNLYFSTEEALNAK